MVAVNELKRYVSAIGTAGALLCCTLMVLGEVAGSTRAATGGSISLAGGVTEVTRLGAHG